MMVIRGEIQLQRSLMRNGDWFSKKVEAWWVPATIQVTSQMGFYKLHG